MHKVGAEIIGSPPSERASDFVGLWKRKTDIPEKVRRDKAAMDTLTIRAMRDELHKIAAIKHPSLLGAGIGASLAAGSRGMREWEDWHKENVSKNLTPKERRRSLAHRLARLGVSTGIGAGSGAVAGHYGGKVLDRTGKFLHKNIKSAIEDAAPEVGKRLKSAVMGD